MQVQQPERRPAGRMISAALFALIFGGVEALKVIAGFPQNPDASQLWSLGGVTALSAALGWLWPPAIDGTSKKNAFIVTHFNDRYYAL